MGEESNGNRPRTIRDSLEVITSPVSLLTEQQKRNPRSYQRLAVVPYERCSTNEMARPASQPKNCKVGLSLFVIQIDQSPNRLNPKSFSMSSLTYY